MSDSKQHGFQPAGGGGGGGGVTDHGALTGLADDDHSQYHNNARGDARYAAIAHVSDTGNPHSVTKTQVGLANVTNDAQLKAADLDTDGTLTANSDAKIASQKAVKTYVDTLVAGLLDFKGSTDASANPNYPAASKGDSYVISVAGKIGGASGKTVAVGDFVVAVADNAGGTEASVGTSWIVLEANITGITSAGLAMIQAANAAAQTALLSAVVGDSGSGGTKGLVPAPAAGDAAAGKFLKADGTFAVPAGGSANSIISGSGTLQGHTDAGSAATSPENLVITFSSMGDGYVQLNINGDSYTFHFANADPGGGVIWLDNTSMASPDDYAQGLTSAVSALSIGGVGGSQSGNIATISNSGTGSSAVISCITNTIGTPSGGGSGSDAVAPSGAIAEVELVSASTGKSLRPLRIFADDDDGLGVDVQVALKVSGVYYPVIPSQTVATNTISELQPLGASELSEFFAGRTSASLIARIIGSPPVGGSVAVYAFGIREI